MIALHAHWTDATLYLWGERVPTSPEGTTGADSTAEESPVFLVSHTELQRRVGDQWDSLLISGARYSELELLLPYLDGSLVSSVGDGRTPSVDVLSARPSLERCRVPTLAFSPADAVDFLTGTLSAGWEDLRVGASLRYWRRVAELTLELLARQRYVPAVHVDRSGRYRGYWRVVVDDERCSDQLRALIAAMPPVCRSLPGEGNAIQASNLVENFLWTTVDALVRRSLEGDELAHSLHDQSGEECPPQIAWLRSLIDMDPLLQGSPERCRAIQGTVEDWLSRLESSPQTRSCRTCIRLRSFDAGEGGSQKAKGRGWRLTLHVQATQDPRLIVDAASLWDRHTDDPAILQRPFAGAREQLRNDVVRAARYFPPLSPCAEPEGPCEVPLTTEEAYHFLRDAAPILEAEDVAVWVPRWWREDRPRLRMQLDLHPPAGDSPVSGSHLGVESVVAYDWAVALGDDSLSQDEMAELAVASAPLVKLRGRWVEVQATDFQAALRFLEKNRSGRMTVFEALRLSYMADDLDTGLPVAGFRAHGWVAKLLNASDAGEQVEAVSPPAGFRGTLRPYQLRGLQWLSFLSRHGLGACLADDMGLGKTIQLIALWLHEREPGTAPGPTLLVVPMSLVGNWQREIARFAPSLRVMVHHGMERLTGSGFVTEVARHDVVISTYGLAHRDHEHLAKVNWHRIALDEAQNIKNPAAKQSVALRLLRPVHRMCLTGTPVENRLSELWSIMDFLNPGYLGGASDFRRRFAVPVERHHDTDRAQRLRHLIRPFLLRRLKGDPDVAVDLPEKLEMTVYCNLTREQAGLYEAVVAHMLGQIDSTGGIQRRGLILATLTKLKQVCNHPAQFLADGSVLPNRSGKCERLVEMLEEVLAEGDRALIFTQYRKMGELLVGYLPEILGRKVLFMHGGTPQAARVEMVERFQGGSGDTPIFLLSLKTGGVGLNLTAASHVFHFDRWWNPAVEDQATDRVHRIGQERQVQVHKFVCIGTLEERIAAMIEKKRALAQNIIGSGEGWVTELSTDALRELFALSREAVAED